MSDVQPNRSRVNLAFVAVAGLLIAGLAGVAVVAWNTQSHASSEAAATAAESSGPPAELPVAAGPEGLRLSWAHDRVWFDGKAEEAVYDATRTIYGKPRSYRAKAFANVEPYASETGTKGYAAGDESPLAFKYHVREDVPTENYVYHFSTMSYTTRADMTPAKVDMGSQEDCGATFKQYRVAGEKLYTSQHSYFPDQGVRDEVHALGGSTVWHDALPLVLRGFPFDEPRDLDMKIVPDATTTKWSPTQPISAKVTSLGEKMFDLPIGEVGAHGLEVRYADGTTETYWFEVASDRQHVMVKADTVHGLYELRSWRRWAYWAG